MHLNKPPPLSCFAPFDKSITLTRVLFQTRLHSITQLCGLQIKDFFFFFFLTRGCWGKTCRVIGAGGHVCCVYPHHTAVYGNMTSVAMCCATLWQSTWLMMAGLHDVCLPATQTSLLLPAPRSSFFPIIGRHSPPFPWSCLPFHSSDRQLPFPDSSSPSDSTAD